MCEGLGCGERNEEDGMILDYFYYLIIVNTHFKIDEYLITYKSGHNYHIDFFLNRKLDKIICENYKIIHGKSSMNQHKLMVLDIYCYKW